MPLTEKGEEIKRNMQKEYGTKKGEQVLYASRNAGTISGIDEDRATRLHRALDCVMDEFERRPSTGEALDALRQVLGEDETFRKLEHSLAHKKGVHNARALSAWIGREHGKIK